MPRSAVYRVHFPLDARAAARYAFTAGSVNNPGCQETGKPLWKAKAKAKAKAEAKAEGILQGLMAARDPLTGLIAPTGTRRTAGVNRHDLMTAPEALATVAKLLAERRKAAVQARMERPGPKVKDYSNNDE